MKTENRVTAQPDFMVKHLGFPGFHMETRVHVMVKHGGGGEDPGFWWQQKTYLTFLQKIISCKKIYFLQKSSFFKNSVRNTCGALVFLSKRACFKRTMFKTQVLKHAFFRKITRDYIYTESIYICIKSVFFYEKCFFTIFLFYFI